ncbi:MAG: RNA polymerase sigma factor [Nitriliruptoraceae bacterium]
MLVAAQADAAWAYRRLYEQFAPLVRGYLRMQGADDPDDLTQEVFVGIFRNITTFSGDESAFRSWILTIAHRRLIDARRRAGRRPRTVALDTQHQSHGDVESEAMARIGEARVLALLERLSPDQRAVLLMRIVGDLSIDDVAHALGKRPGAVKQLQRRGLDTLRRIADAEGISP